GLWVYASERSACIGFETSLPAKAHVEYGATANYGRRTAEATRHHYIHVHYLTDLLPDTDYHFRLRAVDERGNRIASEDATFRTRSMREAIRIPGDLEGPPYVLDRSDATYLVTEDLTIEGMAFDLPQGTQNVTLDLGGHRVVYDNKRFGKIESGNFWDWIRGSQFGVRAMKVQGLRILNGTIRQGAGNDAAQANSIGYNPIYTNGCRNMEIAGVTVRYSGPQQVGIYNHWSGWDSDFHHNVFLDTGTELINRHGAGCRAILFGGSEMSGVKVHHNLVARTRQSGLSGNQVHNNEIYVDSWATNSFGVRITQSGSAYSNRVLGTGYHVCAFGWGNELRFHGNFVHLEGQKPGGRFKEYGDQVSLNGFRLTQYAGSTKPYHGNEYYDNTVVVVAREGAQARGVQFFSDPYVEDLVFRNNTVKAMVADDETHQAACVVTQGNVDRADQHLPILYRDNTFISNICNIRFGDYYGVGSNHRFHGCRFVRVGDDPRYRTFLWDTGYRCEGHVVRDAAFEGGAASDSLRFGARDQAQDLALEWTVTVKTAPGAAVTVTDSTGREVFARQADAGGTVAAALSQFVAEPGGKTLYTPHTIVAEAGGKSARATLTVDAMKTVELPLK
ncbi:MAG: hypothetical protein PVJ27_06065, partial [Candidatus Brocadiaceae bacterium]